MHEALPPAVLGERLAEVYGALDPLYRRVVRIGEQTVPQPGRRVDADGTVSGGSQKC